MSSSVGLPILYPIAVLNYILFYWIYKTLLIKYYAKTTNFDQNLSISAIKFFKISLIFHVLISLFIFSTNLFYMMNENLD